MKKLLHERLRKTKVYDANDEEINVGDYVWIDIEKLCRYEVSKITQYGMVELSIDGHVKGEVDSSILTHRNDRDE